MSAYGPTGTTPYGPYGPTELLVIAKEPVPGRVKTRLCPPFSPAEAAELAAAALADTLETVLA
ncbi:glycosyltransferase, partial [Streptomyces sp. SID2119]|nr:glycosyltransferase [Streptomyces sp. SID2119]